MAVKFSEFTQKPNITEVTEIVGYYASSDLNVRIVPSALDTTYVYSTTDGASPALTLVGTKSGAANVTTQVTLSGLGGTILAGTGTNAISFRSTTYILAAGTNADPAVNTPITLTGNLGGDAHTDTVNLIGTGTVQITSTGGVITIDGGSAGDVTSFTNSNGGTFVAYGTVNTDATGAVTIGDVDLTAGGTASGTTFLRGDNQWATPAGGTDTTYDLTTTADGSNVDVNLVPSTGATDVVKLTPAGGLTITQAGNVITLDTSASGSGTVTSVGTTTTGIAALTLSGTVTNSGDLDLAKTGGTGGQYIDGAAGAWTTLPAGYTSWNLTGDSGTTEAIADGNTVDVAGGTDITTIASSTDTLTVNHDAITRTDTTSTDAPAAGASVALVKTISTSAQGHVTAIDVSTVTWPAAGGLPTKTVDTATIANATTGTFTLTATPSSENYVDMYISGVYQSKTTYTVAGTTVTLDGGTFFPNGAVVETVTTT